jgi:heptaprenyl diphosphate synthase
MQIIEKYKISNTETRDFYLAFFTALACILSYMEGFIPKPFPGIKLGLANSIVLVFVCHSLYKQALFVSVAKVFVVSLFSGYIFSVAFFLGLSGAFFSSVAMILIHKSLKSRVSLFGVSLTGAFFHIVFQLLFAILFMPSIKSGILFISGILLLSSFAAGIVTALFASYIMKNM